MFIFITPSPLKGHYLWRSPIELLQSGYNFVSWSRYHLIIFHFPFHAQLVEKFRRWWWGWWAGLLVGLHYDNQTQVWHWLFLFSSFSHLEELVAASELFQFTIILLLFTVAQQFYCDGNKCLLLTYSICEH